MTVLGVMSRNRRGLRAMAVHVLTKTAPLALDWLFDEETPEQRLPVLVCTSTGIRTAAISYLQRPE
jgi:hypothetical protein